MALTDKNIVITPNVGQASDPQIVFSGADATSGPNNITLRVYPTDGGTLSFEGSAGQLFSLTNTLSGTIYSVNDVSGIPSIEVLDTGLVKLAEYGGNVLIGTGTDNGTDKLQINGNVLATNLKGNLDWSYVQNKPDPVVTVTLTGDVTGTANTTLTDLASGTVSVATTIAANSVALGTDTTGNYVAGLTAGTGITITGTAAEGWSPTVTNSAPNVTTDISITHVASSVTVNSSDGADGTINAATTSLAGVMTATDKTKLDGIATGAEVNQNAFSNIAVSGQTTVAADAKTDTLTLVAGTNVTITTDAGTDSITISATDTNTTYSKATSTTLGLVELGSDTVQTVAANAVTTNASRTYAVQLNADDQMVVNVPWSNTTYSVITEAEVINSASTTGRLITGQRIAYAFANIKAATSGNADTVTIADRTTNESGHAIFIGTTATGNQAIYSNTNYRFNPSTGALSATDFNSTSDIRAKTNLKRIQSPLSIVDQLNGYSFDWKDGSGSSYGVIAQEVEKVLPNSVHDSGELKTVSYNSLIPVLLEAIKELKQEVEYLRNKK